MARKREFRVAVGTPDGPRSTVWKFVVAGSDIYIITRMFGSDAKVSLHASGECQWSGTETWVRKEPERRNAERHITTWTMPRPVGREAAHVFWVRIPGTELRTIPPGEDLSSVKWLPAPPVGTAVSLNCYLTPPAENDPSLSSLLPDEHLFSLQRTDRRWLVVTQSHVPLPDGFAAYRAQIQALAAERGIVLQPEHRACLFSVGDGALRGLIEMCPVSSPHGA